MLRRGLAAENSGRKIGIAFAGEDFASGWEYRSCVPPSRSRSDFFVARQSVLCYDSAGNALASVSNHCLVDVRDVRYVYKDSEIRTEQIANGESRANRFSAGCRFSLQQRLLRDLRWRRRTTFFSDALRRRWTVSGFRSRAHGSSEPRKLRWRWMTPARHRLRCRWKWQVLRSTPLPTYSRANC